LWLCCRHDAVGDDGSHASSHGCAMCGLQPAMSVAAGNHLHVLFDNCGWSADVLFISSVVMHRLMQGKPVRCRHDIHAQAASLLVLVVCDAYSCV
jgi:hypothetical protein